jgi:hypothetical protein
LDGAITKKHDDACLFRGWEQLKLGLSGDITQIDWKNQTIRFYWLRKYTAGIDEITLLNFKRGYL